MGILDNRLFCPVYSFTISAVSDDIGNFEAEVENVSVQKHVAKLYFRLFHMSDSIGVGQGRKHREKG